MKVWAYDPGTLMIIIIDTDMQNKRDIIEFNE